MRIAFVSIPRYPCAVETSRNPSLAGKPFFVSDTGQSPRILDYSTEVIHREIHRGITVREAAGLCPQAMIIPPDPVLYRRIWEETLAALDDISPEIEDEELGRAYLNVTGLHSHYQDESDIGQHIIETVRLASGLSATAGIASGKLPAFAAAVSMVPGETHVVPDGQEKAALSSMTVDLLPFEPEVISRLKMLGLDQIGVLARFTVPELQSQFGFQGERLSQLANGIDTTPLYARPQSELLEDGVTFEAPVSGIDVMVTVCKQLLSRLRPRLRGRAAREVVVQAELASGRGWEYKLVLREAISESDRLSFVLRAALNNFPPPNAVRNLSLRLAGLTGQSGKQLFLGEKRSLQLQLEEAVNQLKARYGYSPVYRCVEVEPWSVIPEERWILVESDA